ncbi:hypothetical protein Csa_023231, partial [Cucumis sativus]
GEGTSISLNYDRNEEGRHCKIDQRAEGFEFVIHKDAAMVSQTIRNMLTSPGNFAESQHREVTFPEISTTILEKICQYFHWNLPIREVFISSLLCQFFSVSD